MDPLPRRALHQDVERLVGDDPSVVDDDDVVDGLRDLGQHVAGQQDRATLAGQTAQEVPQPADALGIQAVRRFVEHEDLGLADQRGGEPEPLVHAQRERAHTPVGGAGQLDQLEDLVDAGPRHPRLGRDDTQVVPRGPRGMGRRLEHGSDVSQRVLEVAVATPGDPYGARRGFDEPEQRPEGRGLARPVRPEEARDRAGRDGEAQVVDGSYVCIVLAEVG